MKIDHSSLITGVGILAIIAIILAAILTSNISKVEEKPLQIWAVRCDQGLVEYISPARIPAEQEKALCGDEPKEY